MDEMKLLEEFCAAEPEPHPGWLARTRSDLATSIGTAGQDAATRARGHWWSRLPARPRRTATIPRSHAARGWFTPLAAAVAVVVAVAVPLTVFHGPGLRPAHRTQAATAAGPAGTPTYYM